MSKQADSNSKRKALTNPHSDNQRHPYRDYSNEDKVIALATVAVNGGNIYRTARGLQIPYATLYGWIEERKAGPLGLSKFEKEKRGDLAGKMESVLHTLIESMSSKVGKATLSQTAVAAGILTDKIRILRGQGLEPDPAMELCRLLGINRSQLPPTLELEPGEEMPQEFAELLLELKPKSDGSFEVEPMKHPEKCSHREGEDTTEQAERADTKDHELMTETSEKDK